MLELIFAKLGQPMRAQSLAGYVVDGGVPDVGFVVDLFGAQDAVEGDGGAGAVVFAAGDGEAA
jgi:hypothetical protein